jgi:hypothetical protein
MKTYYLILNDISIIDGNHLDVTVAQYSRKFPFSNWYEITEKDYFRIKYNYSVPIHFAPDKEIKEIMNFFKLEELAI